MSYITEAYSAGETKRYEATGTFFRLLLAASAVSVIFFRNRQRINESVQNVTTGFYFETPLGFDAVEITSANAQTIALITSEGKVGFSESVNITGGTVAVSGLTPSRFTGANTQKTVTTASAQLVAALATRNYLLVQNKDASGNIYLKFGAGAATADNGIRIGPGGSYEQNCNVTTGAITAIGDIASNPNIVVVEG